MESEGNFRLIIKAPNQNVQDYEVQCNFNWSIQQLKNHLSEVYPSKPTVHEQKLIYAGRLLQDHLQLKDVLRPEDRQVPVHIFHLVCKFQQSEKSEMSSQNVPFSKPANSGAPESSLSEESNNGSGSISNLSQRIVPSFNLESTAEQTSFSIPTSAVPLHLNEIPPSIQQLYVNYFIQQRQNIPLHSSYIVRVPQELTTDPLSYDQLLANYYAQYMQNLQIFYQLNNIPAAVSIQQPSRIVDNNQNAVVAPRVVAPGRNIRMNAQGGPVLDDDEPGNDDWLDYFYLCCRGFVLFSIIYFYSSPERLLLVIIIAFVVFMYQEGLLIRGRFNGLAENGGNRLRQRRPVQNDRHNTEETPAQNETVDVAGIRENEIEAIMDAEDPPHVQNQVRTDYLYPTWWTFILSFFTSLIPEQPAPVNLN